MDKVLSIRRNTQIFSLFFQIQKLQKSTNRTEIVNAAINRALSESVNWKEVAAAKLPTISITDINTPDFIQLRVDADNYKTITKQIHDHFLLEKMPPTPYVIRLLLTYYLIYLQEIDTKGRALVCEKSFDFSETLTPEEFQELPSIDAKLDHLYYILYNIKNAGNISPLKNSLEHIQ